MSKKKVLFITSILMTICLFCVLSHTDVHTLPLHFVMEFHETENQYPQITCWKNEQNLFYVFIPSYGSLANINIVLDSGADVTINHTKVTDGMNCAIYKTDVVYECSFRYLGKVLNANIVFLNSSNLPTLYIDTESGSMDSVHVRKGNKESGMIRIYAKDGKLEYSGKITGINGRGNSSWDGFEKKPYSIELEQEANLLNMGSASKWVLLANAGDPSHIRNKLIYEFAKEFGLAYAPESEWVDLYLNGEYAGLYLLSERNEVHPERVDLPLESGILVSKENTSHLMSKNVPKVTTVSGYSFRIHNGNDETEIMNHLQSIENAILAENGIDPVTGKHLTELIDVDSWARKYLIEEVFGNVDAGHASQFYYWNATDGKVYAGPVWDYDNAIWGETANGLFANQLELKSGVYAQWNHALYQKKDFLEHVKLLYNDEFIPLLNRFLEERIGLYTQRIVQANEMDQNRWPEYGGNVVEETEYIQRYLQDRKIFLTEFWSGENQYCYVRIDVGGNSNYLYYAVKLGTCLEALPAVDQSQLIGWVYEESGEQYERSHPIVQDTCLVAKWHGGDSTVNRMIQELIPILMIALLFFAVLILNLLQIKRESVDKL